MKTLTPLVFFPKLTLHNLFVALTLLLCAVLALVAYLWLAYGFRRSLASKYIPGIRLYFWDILGNWKHIIRSAPRRKSFPLNVCILQVLSAYTQLFRDKELFAFWFSYTPFVIFVKAEAVEELISGTKMMQKAWGYSMLHPWLGTGLLTSHGSKWKTRRKLLTPTFHFDILKDFLPVFNEQSQILVQVLQKETEKPWTDIVKPITLCSLDIICETTLGASVGAQKDSESEYIQAILRVSEVLMERMTNPKQWVDWIFNLTAVGRKLKKDINVLHMFTRKVIQDKKSLLLKGVEGGQDRKRKALMDLLLEHHIKNQDITEEDIREEVDTFVFEGHDTTSMGMSWALYLIGLHEDVQAKIHEELDLVLGTDVTEPITMNDLNELKYLNCTLKESQRLYPSVPMFGRHTNEEITIRGYKIPKGSTCTVLSYELHRDEKVFPDPEKFDPDRFLPENTIGRHPYAYIPFSAGPRNCIGQRFAVMEEKIVLANILRNFHLKSLQQRDEVHPLPELILRAYEPLKIKITPRHIFTSKQP